MDQYYTGNTDHVEANEEASYGKPDVQQQDPYIEDSFSKRNSQYFKPSQNYNHPTGNNYYNQGGYTQSLHGGNQTKKSPNREHR
jgi:hypothetical protein